MEKRRGSFEAQGPGRMQLYLMSVTLTFSSDNNLAVGKASDMAGILKKRAFRHADQFGGLNYRGIKRRQIDIRLIL